MSNPTLTNVFIWCYLFPRDWRCSEINTGITAIGQTRDEALAGFKNVWGERAPFQLIEHAPPRPKRSDDPKRAVAAVEGESVVSAFHRAIVREFHPDHHPDRTYTGHDILAAVNRLWDEATAKT
jgi:hypothetical protein